MKRVLQRSPQVGMGQGAHLPRMTRSSVVMTVWKIRLMLERLLTPRGDAVKGLVVVLQGTTALTEKSTQHTLSQGEQDYLPLCYTTESKVLSKSLTHER